MGMEDSLPLERCEGDSHGNDKKGMGKMRKLIGKLVRIHNHPVLSDIFGVYLGSRINSSWDSQGIYPLHKILTPLGVREVCIGESNWKSTLEVLT